MYNKNSKVKNYDLKIKIYNIKLQIQICRSMKRIINGHKV